MKDFVLEVALKQTRKATRKSPTPEGNSEMTYSRRCSSEMAYSRRQLGSRLFPIVTRKSTTPEGNSEVAYSQK